MAITTLELKALRASDDGKKLVFGNSMYGTVRVGIGNVISVYAYWRYKVNGKNRQAPLGTWKDKDGLSLKSLRDIRDQMAAELKMGIDPLERKEAVRLKAKADQIEAIQSQKTRISDLEVKDARITVRDLFALWHRNGISSREDKGLEAERSFTRDVFPLIGDTAAADVTKAHIYEVLDAIKSRATPTQSMVRTSKKTLSDLRQMFGFAVDRGIVEQDPTYRVKKASIGKDVERDRVLNEAEIC